MFSWHHSRWGCRCRWDRQGHRGPDRPMWNNIAGKDEDMRGFFEVHWDSLRFIGILWDSLRFTEIHWGSLGFFGILWGSLRFIEVHWDSLGFFEVQWDSLRFIGIHGHSLQFLGFSSWVKSFDALTPVFCGFFLNVSRCVSVGVIYLGHATCGLVLRGHAFPDQGLN